MKKSFPKGLFFALCYFFYTSIYLSRINLSMASPALLADGVLTEVELGFIGSAFSVIYAIGRLCNGVLGDRLAPWVMVSAGLLGTGIANMFIGVLPPYLLILGLWCINAFAQSMLWSALLRCITAIYGREEANRKATILVSSVSAGNIGSILLSSVLVSNFGVSAAFYVPGAVCVICGVTAMYILRQVPDTDRIKVQKSTGFGPLLRNREMRGMLVPAMVHGAIRDNVSLWMVVYFLDRFAIDLKSSAWYVLLIPLIGMAARLAYPLCYKWSRQREHLISLYSFGACVVFAGILCLQPSVPIVTALCLSMLYALVSMVNTSLTSVFPLRFTAQNMVSSVSGVSDFFTYIGSGIGQAVYGFVVAQFGYLPMFLSWAVLSVVSVLLVLRQKPFTLIEV